MFQKNIYVTGRVNLLLGERRGSDWLYEILKIYRDNIDGSEKIECLKTIGFFWGY